MTGKCHTSFCVLGGLGLSSKNAQTQIKVPRLARKQTFKNGIMPSMAIQQRTVLKLDGITWTDDG